jgi:CRISPR-associated protein Cmr6
MHGVLAVVLDRVSPLPHRVDQNGTPINADLLMKRLYIGDDPKASTEHLSAVARAARAVPGELLTGLHTRRAAAAAALTARGGRNGDLVVVSMLITPEWRMVVGHGESTAHETSLSMSPTYGVPILPAAGLKGAAAAQARATDMGEATVRRLFGSPRPKKAADVDNQDDDNLDDPDACLGSVTIGDGLPVDPPRVVVDVLTPHVVPYYRQVNQGAAGNGTLTEPPAEWHSPVPVHFLAVESTPFRALLIGPKSDVDIVANLLAAAVCDNGIGGKTAAGYGYCEATVEPG